MGYARDILAGIDFLTNRSRSSFEHQWRRKTARSDPYQKWNDDHQAIFVHIPKAAGQSVKDALGLPDHDEYGHLSAEGFRQADSDRFERYISFAIVRDPLSRLRSAFQYLRATTVYPHDQAWARRHLSKTETFSDFVDRLETDLFRATVLPWIHFRPQFDFVTNLQGERIVDTLLRLESLDQTFEPFCQSIGITTSLPQKNQSQSQVREPDLTSRQLATVKTIYRKDYELLGYRV